MGIFIEVLGAEYSNYYAPEMYSLLDNFEEVLETSESGLKTQLIEIFIKTLKAKKENYQMSSPLRCTFIEILEAATREQREELENIWLKE